MTARPVSAPRGLAEGGRALWRGVTRKHKLRPDELRILEDACRTCDVIDDLHEALKGAPRTVQGSAGQTVANPLLSEIRMHRSVLNALVRALSLDKSDGSEADAALGRREAATALARARWSRSAS
jgi:hypothetical protein